MNKHDPSAVREAAVFKSNRSQAVRIPKDLAFAADVKRVTIEPTEDGGLVIKPVKDPAQAWRDYLRNGPFLAKDFDPNIPDPPPSDDIAFDD
ncbi:MAG: AbrB/MazE/SpoVT family DNA-binding domain-containing protein [Devosia sp.]|uniref:antitoxin n=1 Tax=Devosia sp. TaxID=1871048 RepID=UPI001AD5E20C|nr:AbrB/MazE/SpoVT family DNA-binding domain-containing protein [Devosia sp.]MBN9309904.1 AbrB/MazE/SpoVT family DNA-binding domain-containing protein [Devosia sp.]MBN9316556.1 AbrB/MazE/SpoVT family DNA-binding domain-containing protein [Devosia sp.]